MKRFDREAYEKYLKMRAERFVDGAPAADRGMMEVIYERNEAYGQVQALCNEFYALRKLADSHSKEDIISILDLTIKELVDKIQGK